MSGGTAVVSERDAKSVLSRNNVEDDDPKPGHTIEHYLLGGDRWARMKRFAAVSVMMFLGFLFLNALFVFYSLYRLSKISMDQVNIFLLQVDRLCDEQAEIRLRLGFRDVVGLEVIGVEFDKPIELSMALSSIHQQPIANVTIPEFSFGYDKQELDFSEHPIILSLNEDFPFQAMVDHLNEDLKADITLFASFRTTSFIIPIRMARTFSFSMPINHQRNEDAESSNSLLTLDRINFVNDPTLTDISIESLIGVKPGLVPHFLSIITPKLSMDIYKLNGVGSLPEHLSTIVSPAQTINNASPHIKVEMTLSNADRLSIVDSIKKVLKKDDGLLFSIHSNLEDAEKCKFQRLLTNMSMQISLGELLTMTRRQKTTAKASRLPHFSPTRSGPIAKFAFNGGLHENTIGMRSTFDSEYFLGLAGLSSTRVVGQFPPVSLSVILEHGIGSQSRNDTLTALQITHDPVSAHGSFVFDIDMEFTDGEQLIKALTRAGQVERPIHLVHPELRPYKRAFLTGTPNGSLMSAILSLFELQMRFSNGQVEFTNDLFKDFSGVSTSGPVLVDFLAPEKIHHPVKHSVMVRASQDERVGTIQFHGDLQKEAVMANPVVELAWERIDVSAGYEKERLFNLLIEEGKLRCSLAPLRPSLLLHQGRVDARLLIDGTESVGSLFEDLRDGTQFASVTFNGSIGNKPLKVKTALPPVSAISTTVMGLEQDKQTNNDNQAGLKTHTRLVGIKSSRMQMLIDLGEKTFCAPPNPDFGSVINVDVELPRMTSNVCIFKGTSMDHQNVGCLAQIRTLPVKLTAKIVDASICGLQSVTIPKELEEDYVRRPVESVFATLVNDPDSNNNWLPLDVDVYDYKKAFEALDAMYEDVNVPFTLAPGDNPERPAGASLDKFMNGLSTIVTYRLNFAAPTIPPNEYDTISTLPESMPINTVIDIWSETRQSLRGQMTITIPKEAAFGVTSTDCTAKTIEWGPLEMELKATPTDWFKMSMTEARIFMATPHENCPASTNTFRVDFELHSGVEHLNSGDLRRAIHHLVTNHLHRHSPIISEMHIDEQRLQMSATVGEFRSPTEFKTLSSRLKLKTLAQLGHVAFAKYKYGKASGLPTDWNIQMRLEGLPQVAQNKTIAEDVIPFPCFFNKPCGDLIYKPSPRSHLAKVEIAIDSLIQRIFDTSINTIGRIFNKLNWQRYPTAGSLVVRLHDPLYLTAALNDNIDIAQVIVPPLHIQRQAAVEYPLGNEKRVFAKRALQIERDQQKVNVYVQVPQYYHDLTGLFVPIDFDPIVRVELEAPPEQDLNYSPLSMTLSTERIVTSNLLSSIGCVVIEEIATNAMPGVIGPSDVEKSVTAPITNEQLLEIHIENIMVPNPTSIMSMVFDKAILAEYEYRGKVFGRGRVEPFALKPGTNKLSVKAQLTKDCFGRCQADSESVKEDMGRFLVGTALGAALDVTMVAHVAPHLSIAIPFRHPHRSVPLAVFDAEASMEAFAEHGIRTVNALDPVFNGRPSGWWSWLTRWTGKATAVAAQRTHQRPQGTWREAVTGRLWQWWYGDAESTDTSDTSSEMSEQDERGWFQWARDLWTNYWYDNTEQPPKPETNNNQQVQGTTRGRTNYDLNIPICLRNDADIEMRVFGLYLNIAFDDTDGFYFTRDTDRSLIRNTMYLAQRDCQPASTATPFHRDAFIKCILEHPAGPASVLHARSSLAGSKAVMTPIPLSRQFVARVLDEAVNHDGPCLRITTDSFISVGLSNGQGRDDQFVMNIPLDMWKDLEMNPFGDACGTRSHCRYSDKASASLPLPLHYHRPLTDDHEPLNSNDTFHLDNQQLWFHEQLSSLESWQIDFTVEMERASAFRVSSALGGLAFVMQQNGKNVTLAGDTLYGYHQLDRRQQSRPNVNADNRQPLDRSLAIVFEPHTVDDRPLALRTVSNLPYLYWKGSPPNAISFLHNGRPTVLRIPNPRALQNPKERKELLLKKINGVFPPYDNTLRFTIVHNAGERQVYVYGRGEEQRSPTHHSIFPVDLMKLLPHGDRFWFGFTARAEGAVRDWNLHSISVRHLRPSFPKTRVFWPDTTAPKPNELGTFWMQLRDECDRAMAMAHGDLMVQLQLIDSKHPRHVVAVGDEPEVRSTRRSARNSLFYAHEELVVVARAEFDVRRRLYRVTFESPVPGRFAIQLRTLSDADWTAVKWHTILVRPYF